ncbi:hypothetical protein BDN72DRAFT_848638 [Pluteus cervinus]|uniref:Uncharacterized protein n=1 Tax=Pluteus cervinus TaxID=181527 RepID=A0ACD3A9W4_9AGAR|nr:hypothetical protein BDN72DRAFT_848638 [Pluteus cervinus]
MARDHERLLCPFVIGLYLWIGSPQKSRTGKGGLVVDTLTTSDLPSLRRPRMVLPVSSAKERTLDQKDILLAK